MKTQNCLQKNAYNAFKPQFTSNLRQVFNPKTKQFLYQNNSCFFRDDLRWNDLADTIIKKYKNAEKVNIYNFACSDGSEPFSLAMILMEKLGIKKAQKFFPILASDIDAKILKNPQKGVLKLSNDDICFIKENIGDNYSKYIEFDKNFRKSAFLDEKVCTGKIKQPLADSVIFEQKDIFNGLNDINSENSIVFCRNFWSYKSDDEQLFALQYKSCPNNSLDAVSYTHLRRRRW